MAKTTADLLVERLVEWGVDTIFYFTPLAGTLMAAPIRLGDTVEVEVPRQLFTVRIRYFAGIVRTQYDVAPDDQHFLINVTSQEQAQTPVSSTRTGSRRCQSDLRRDCKLRPRHIAAR